MTCAAVNVKHNSYASSCITSDARRGLSWRGSGEVVPLAELLRDVPDARHPVREGREVAGLDEDWLLGRPLAGGGDGHLPLEEVGVLVAGVLPVELRDAAAPGAPGADAVPPFGLLPGHALDDLDGRLGALAGGREQQAAARREVGRGRRQREQQARAAEARSPRSAARGSRHRRRHLPPPPGRGTQTRRLSQKGCGLLRLSLILTIPAMIVTITGGQGWFA